MFGKGLKVQQLWPMTTYGRNMRFTGVAEALILTAGWGLRGPRGVGALGRQRERWGLGGTVVTRIPGGSVGTWEVGPNIGTRRHRPLPRKCVPSQ